MVIDSSVATVLTACGIETLTVTCVSYPKDFKLQQYLPLAVLKHLKINIMITLLERLQQYLPLAVLKRSFLVKKFNLDSLCCNSTYRLRYWNVCILDKMHSTISTSCNSTYRLRYWNHPHLFESLSFQRLTVATALTACGIETFQYSILFLDRMSVATALTACGIETS